MSREEVEKLERKLGYIVEYLYCVFIALIRGDKRPNCNLCNNDLVAFVLLKIIQEYSQNDLTRKIF